MNHNNKIKLLSLSIAVIAVIAFLIIPSLNNSKKEAGIPSGKKEEINNKASEDATNSNALSAENTTGTLYASDDSNMLEEAEKRTTVISEKTKENINALIKEYYGNTEKINKGVLAAAKEKEVEKEAESITEKREGIEKYSEIKTIIKAGLNEGTYLVFTTYNMKFFNIETKAPGMSVIYVITDKNKTLAVEHDTSDPNLQKYINELSLEEEIKTEIERVNTELASATKKDETLKDFINKLQKVSK